LALLYPDTDWVRLFAKIGELLARDYDWSTEIAEVTAPTMPHPS
jgi:hypothetical protein